MFWLKRLALPVLLIIHWFAYSTYDKYRTKKFAAQADHHALVTAQIWVGSAELRKDPAAYLVWRDSVLAANSLSASEMDNYLQVFQGNRTGRQEFAAQINQYVDSIVNLRDSLRQAEAKRIRDSVVKARKDSLLTAAGNKWPR